MGSLQPWAGVDLTLRAVALVAPGFPNVSLRIVGGGGAEKELRQLAVDLGIGKQVEFVGPIAYENLPTVMDRTAIAVAMHPPSRLLHFGDPLKTLDYMAAGLPIITTDHGKSDYVRDHDAGWTVPYDVAAVAQAIRDALVTPSGLSRKGANGRRFVASLEWKRIFADQISKSLD
jgi:glycosyltransferase involved in cell wall biosynthesis